MTSIASNCFCTQLEQRPLIHNNNIYLVIFDNETGNLKAYFDISIADSYFQLSKDNISVYPAYLFVIAAKIFSIPFQNAAEFDLFLINYNLTSIWTL